jgi:hypothetical protein
MAPTPGDVGGCGSEAVLLDRASYEATRRQKDCQRCEECGVTTARCARACDPAKPQDLFVPPSCLPLLHDGQVCIRALGAASCADFATYVDDVAPRTPSECQFCRQGTSP